MQFSFRTACLAATVIIGATAIASAQGGSTDRNGNAIGSQHVGSGGGHMSGGAMHNGMKGTTGMNSGSAARDNPNGSPGSAPKAKAGRKAIRQKTTTHRSEALRSRLLCLDHSTTDQNSRALRAAAGDQPSRRFRPEDRAGPSQHLCRRVPNFDTI